MAFLLNLGFTAIEIAGGLWTNSIAVLTDALHDGGDCLSLGIAWYLHRLSSRERTAAYTYGYRRFSVLGALVTGLVLLGGLGFMLWHAVQRLRDPEPVMAPGMILLAVLGILINGAAVLKTRRGKSLNEKIASWHLLEDTLGWLAVLIGGTIMVFRDWPVIDPLLSILIAGFVLINVGRNLQRVFSVLLQRRPSSFDVESFESAIRNLPQVRSVHHTHAWTLDGEHHVLSTHLVLKADTSRERILEAKQCVCDQLKDQAFEHITVEVELEGEPCHSNLNSSQS